MKTVGERIKEIMAKNEWRAVDVCKKTGLPKSTISQYIRGTTTPNHDRIVLLAQMFDVSPAWLMGYNVDPAPTEVNTTEIKNGNTLRLYSYIDKMTFEEQELMLHIAESIYAFRHSDGLKKKVVKDNG